MIHEYGIIIGHSKFHIKSDKKEAILKAIEELKRHIEDLSRYIEENPHFQYSLEPLNVNQKAPLVVQKMVEASKIAGVGPMAAVAGAIADLGIEVLIRMGANIALVENGGEISVYTISDNIIASISTSEPNLTGKIGFLITKYDSPLGIGTSSGKSGQTISFGEADSVTVIANNAAIADAAATSVCNAVTGSDIKKSILKGLEKARGIKGVRGAIVVREGHIGMIGNLPKIVKVR
ncbi:MAG: UPF0280 family protein [Candidatus Bathyarchaeia archaeon]